jgi:hypothetical protein
MGGAIKPKQGSLFFEFSFANNLSFETLANLPDPAWSSRFLKRLSKFCRDRATESYLSFWRGFQIS